ncbi:HAMP domain-containing histidine kinase [Sarcina sp. JB2]|uniref:HAMP domain-containing histidine kinase n=1 Tax=Candidatus Sarcina troglodytae TaxID=2726954 RepID=A0ACD1BC98_9CLOT|nr:HAMP domain-containing histidine kinase [Sarcina sp. JB2]
MFKKLRFKLLLINMSLLTTVFIAIFGTIFVISSINMNREISTTLYSLIYNAPKVNPSTTFIALEIDQNGNIMKQTQSFNTEVDKTILKNVAHAVLNNKVNSGIVTISDSSYSYLKSINLNTKITRIVFVDRSNYQNFLYQLLKSFLLVGLLSLVILFIISVYLTNKTIQPIKQAFDKQKQFIADASHELKTPLTIIKTNTSLILSNPDDSVKYQAKWINYINSQIDRMSKLIDEMLSLAKLDAQESNIILLPVNISKIIESMILMFDAIIYENNLNLESDIKKDVFVHGDKENLKRLFSILMDNAIKHTNKNGTLSIKLFVDRNKVKIIVKNTGQGIAKENLEKIFDRYYRADNSRDRKTGGYGLGLAIAKSIVLKHKGKIYVQSTVNKNTSFIIELPK